MSRLDPDVLASLHGQIGKYTLSLSLSLSLSSSSFSLSYSPFILNTHTGSLTHRTGWVSSYITTGELKPPLKTTSPLRPSPYILSLPLSLHPSLPLSLSLFLSISQEKLTCHTPTKALSRPPGVCVCVCVTVGVEQLTHPSPRTMCRLVACSVCPCRRTTVVS